MHKLKKILKDLIPAYILSFVTSFMLYIYEPILTYSSNIDDFWFDFKTMITPIILFFLILFVVLSIFYTIVYFLNYCGSKKKKMIIYKIILILSYVVFIFIYIQGNYLIKNLPSLDGTTIEWGTYLKDNIISFAILIIVFIAEFILLKKLKIKKTIKTNNFITIAIFLMILTSFVSRLLVPGVFREKVVANATTRNINNASSDKNFFIFLVDAVDSSAFSKVLNESPEYSSTFTDFTYYPDTVSAYLFTRDSIPFIFSGKWNENEKEFNEYSNEAFENSSLLNNLRNNNYQMNFYEYQVSWNSRKAENFSNIDIYNDGIRKKEFCKNLTKYILFKYLPYSLKQYSKIETMNFDSCKIEQDNNFFKWDNDIAYNTIKNNEMKIEENRYFQFMHIEGGHVPFDYDENVNKISEEEGTYELKLKATLNIINAFITRLKENNVYDNSAIIIMADHGYWYESSGRQNPILYVKGINEHHDMISSEKSVSYEDLNEIYTGLLEGKTSEELLRDINPNRVRRFIDNAFEGEDNMVEYEQRGKAWDNSASVATGKEFKR